MSNDDAISEASSQFLRKLTEWHEGLQTSDIVLVREEPLDPLDDGGDLAVTLTRSQAPFFLTIQRYRDAYDANIVFIRGTRAQLPQFGLRERKGVYPGTIVSSLERESIRDRALFDFLNFVLANPIALVTVRLCGRQVAQQYEYAVDLDTRIRFSESETYFPLWLAGLPGFQKAQVPIGLWRP